MGTFFLRKHKPNPCIRFSSELLDSNQHWQITSLLNYPLFLSFARLWKLLQDALEVANAFFRASSRDWTYDLFFTRESLCHWAIEALCWAVCWIRTSVCLRIMITSQAESTTVPFRQKLFSSGSESRTHVIQLMRLSWYHLQSIPRYILIIYQILV